MDWPDCRILSEEDRKKPLFKRCVRCPKGLVPISYADLVGCLCAECRIREEYPDGPPADDDVAF
jgi:hypothetical protein